MHATLWKLLSASLLAVALAGCAGPEMAVRRGSPLASSDGSPARDCTEDTVVALAVGRERNLYWCTAAAPALETQRQLRNPDGTWSPLPGFIQMRPAGRKSF